MRFRGGELRLTPAGVAVVIAVILFIAAILYATFQPKQVEYIYETVERFFYPSQIPEVTRPNV